MQEHLVQCLGRGESDVPGALKDSSLLSQRLWSRIDQHEPKGGAPHRPAKTQDTLDTHIHHRICTHTCISV